MNSRARIIGLTIFLLISLSTGAGADGIRFKGDHIDDPSTTITLTFFQRLVSLLHLPITLTSGQSELLRKEAEFSPSKIHLLSLSYAKNTCTCELLNVGVRTGSRRVEIPHQLLGETFETRGAAKRAPISPGSVLSHSKGVAVVQFGVRERVIDSFKPGKKIFAVLQYGTRLPGAIDKLDGSASTGIYFNVLANIKDPRGILEKGMRVRIAVPWLSPDQPAQPTPQGREPRPKRGGPLLDAYSKK